MATAGKYRVKPDLSDWRDRYYNYARSAIRESVDLRDMARVVQSQSDLGSCTAQAIVAAYEILLKHEYPSDFAELSPLFVYYNTRMEDGTINEDTGAYLRDALKALGRYGVCTEEAWPYDPKRFNLKPSAEAYRNANKYRIKDYRRLTSIDNILDSLSNNHPVVAGIMVYSSFEQITKESTVLSMPDNLEKELGAHAILLVGYDLNRKQLLAQNSFGSNWGEKGYFWIPFDYMQQELTDAWIFNILVKKIDN